ncbi:caspase family protein [Microcoleus sp. ZQ-A2]|nr:caspase family protein [Microcoleus sp. FACHB-1]
MANHACIAIGINHYQFLPPLNYGEADAQAIWQFWMNQADLPSNQCLLLSDTSRLMGNQSSYPTRDNILSALERNSPTSGNSGNWRWFFFSGYGVRWEQVDYFLPIDANPKDIPGTAISARSLLASLKAQGDENLLVFLDINRSPGLQAGAPVGSELVELARQMGIVLVLSSQLDQFSHEAAGLGHGLFTTTLLEALTYYHTDTTLEKLEQYLRDRLPELSQHHWRPIQTPLLVIPPQTNKQQRIWPTTYYSRGLEPNPVSHSMTFRSATRWDAEDADQDHSYNGIGTPRPTSVVSVLETPTNTSSIPVTTTHQTESMPMAMVPYTTNSSEAAGRQTPWLQQLLLWGSGAVLVLALMIAGVLFRNRDAFTDQPVVETSTGKDSPSTSSPATEPLSPQTDAEGTLNPTTALPQTGQPSRLQANQETLDQARHLLRPNQASLFNKAIVQARQVKPSDPLYPKARRDITRWSGVILDLAEGRAKAGNLGGAIAAAQLVPKDDPSVYGKAQQTINRWKVLATQQQQNKTLIQEAKQQIEPNQASSYSRAITTLRPILPEQPGYGEAQQLTAQWSRTIYLIAQSRASRGKLQEAIQSASLVPAGTPSAEAAKVAIAKWQQGKR